MWPQRRKSEGIKQLVLLHNVEKIRGSNRSKLKNKMLVLLTSYVYGLSLILYHLKITHCLSFDWHSDSDLKNPESYPFTHDWPNTHPNLFRGKYFSMLSRSLDSSRLHFRTGPWSVTDSCGLSLPSRVRSNVWDRSWPSNHKSEVWQKPNFQSKETPGYEQTDP